MTEEGELFRSVAEDLEWFRKEWWEAQGESLSEGHIRRGSTTLHLLLVDGIVGKAWRHYGFLGGQPTLDGPDVVALAASQGLRLDMAASLVAGGGRANSVDAAFIGAFRVDNPTTGVPAEADEGFAVSVTFIARDAASPLPSDIDKLVHRQWKVSEFLEAPGAIRRGITITRREVIDYFRNYVGGAHHDLLKHSKHRSKNDLIQELERRVRADTRDGLYFELLSIGQAVGRSEDMKALAEKIREGR
ncbi:MAG TPA: hypothetical protein VMZ30_22080 [Pyrinomonadaceae bacterium]|nr:hypothetical protein [Pyrinomonadaceae bacterium]